MINKIEIKYNIDGRSISFNRKIEPSDWRYSAAIVGMIRFFQDRNIAYKIEGRYLYYNFEDISGDINDDRDYLYFVEKWFSDKMMYKQLYMKLNKEEFSEKEITEINKLYEKISKSNKDIFKDIKFDRKNGSIIRELIETNKLELIKEAYCSSNTKIRSIYKSFIKDSTYRKQSSKVCRLLGFYVDAGRKTKSIGFCFDKDARTYNDEIEFDFIPFAFSRSGTSIFINNNTSIDYLMSSNNEMEDYLEKQFENQKTWNSIFYSYFGGFEFIDFDVEVIIKNMETDFYESMFIRKAAIEIFKIIAKNKGFSESLNNIFKRYIKIGENFYINVMEEVTKSILNELSLDDLIELIMKVEYESQSNTPDTYCLSRLIYINELIYKNMEDNMEKSAELIGSSISAAEVTRYFIANGQENKIKGYQQRLANTLISKDYNRFIEIMLQLSSYTQVPFIFMHKLIEDFESNKNLAYNFINSLIIKSNVKEGGTSNEK
jgi:CRISPR-associated protein csx8 (provisional)